MYNQIPQGDNSGSPTESQNSTTVDGEGERGGRAREGGPEKQKGAQRNRSTAADLVAGQPVA
jgi:hypothetical protein